MSNINAFNQVMALNESHENKSLGEMILMLEHDEMPVHQPAAPKRQLIDDAVGIIGNHRSPVAKAILHLDFLHEDIMNHAPLKQLHFDAFVDSQYGCLRANLIAALKPSGHVDLDVVNEFEKRGYPTSPNIKTHTVVIRVGHSILKI